MEEGEVDCGVRAPATDGLKARANADRGTYLGIDAAYSKVLRGTG